MEKDEIRKEAEELAEKLKACFGTNAAAAKWLGVPRKTYSDWFVKGFGPGYKWKMVKAFILAAMDERRQ